MPAKDPLHTPVTLGSVVGGATWGLRNGFDVACNSPRARSLYLILEAPLTIKHAYLDKGHKALCPLSRFVLELLSVPSQDPLVDHGG